MKITFALLFQKLPPLPPALLSPLPDQAVRASMGKGSQRKQARAMNKRKGKRCPRVKSEAGSSGGCGREAQQGSSGSAPTLSCCARALCCCPGQGTATSPELQMAQRGSRARPLTAGAPHSPQVVLLALQTVLVLTEGYFVRRSCSLTQPIAGA